VGGVVAMQVAELPAADGERELAPPPWPGLDAGQEVTSFVMRWLAVMTASYKLK
jgi:hypothetical protein